MKCNFPIKKSPIILTSNHDIPCSNDNGRFTRHIGMAGLFTLLVTWSVTVCILRVINRCMVIGSRYPVVIRYQMQVWNMHYLTAKQMVSPQTYVEPANSIDPQLQCGENGVIVLVMGDFCFLILSCLLWLPLCRLHYNNNSKRSE